MLTNGATGWEARVLIIQEESKLSPQVILLSTLRRVFSAQSSEKRITSLRTTSKGGHEGWREHLENWQLSSWTSELDFDFKMHGCLDIFQISRQLLFPLTVSACSAFIYLISVLIAIARHLIVCKKPSLYVPCLAGRSRFKQGDKKLSDDLVDIKTEITVISLTLTVLWSILKRKYERDSGTHQIHLSTNTPSHSEWTIWTGLRNTFCNIAWYEEVKGNDQTFWGEQVYGQKACWEG